MNLQPGQKVGPYQVVSELGRGGMAVVYKAWQPSLERHVALKVLPPYFGHEPEFLIRFRREARAAARLSHPSIVTIHDVGEAQGIHFIAMEYLEGGSLRERLDRGPINQAESLRIIDQLASGLDYAHARRMVHRDIKPGNILFTADGRAKIADFGIARPSDEVQLTRTGALMGTPEYMAPEQAEGLQVDHRADLYALGVVLYQMVTGVAPFRRTTPHATLHAVVYEDPPPPRKANPLVSQGMERVLLKSLAKRPGARFQTGAELSAALRKAVSSAPRPRAKSSVEARPAAKRRKSPVAWILAATAALLVVVFGLLLLLVGGSGRSESSELPALTARSQGILVPEPTLPPSTEPVPAVRASAQPSEPPDASGTLPAVPTEPPSPFFGRLAFTSNRDGNAEIYVVDLAEGEPRRMTNGAADDWLPDWSPDGSRIAFTSSRGGGYDLWVMSASGADGTATVTTAAWDDYGRWAPDGQRLALSSTGQSQGVPNSEIFVWSPHASLVQLTSSPAEDQWPDWSPSGRIIYSEGWKGTNDWDIYAMDADGSNRGLWLGGPSLDVQATWSHDGKRVAFIRVSEDTNGNGHLDEEDRGDVWIGDADAAGLRQLTSGRWAMNPAWSPDRKWVAFASQRDSNGNGKSDRGDASDLYAVRVADGDVVALVQSTHQDYAPSWAW